MLWVIWDILVPLALAFLSGLFCGWLFWRWRRMRMTADELAAIKRSSARYKSDADTLRSRNAELAERLRTTNGASDSNTSQDLEAANKQVDKLRDQLKQLNREHARLRDGQSHKSVTAATSVSALHAVGDTDRSTDSAYLEEEIAVRDKMIATLKHSLEQYGGQQDTTALMAELELKEQKIIALENLLSDSQRVA